MKAKWFTLVETLIAVIVIWILAVILMKTYTFISQISFRIQQEKNVIQETLFISQIFQTLSNRNNIDYNKYNQAKGTWYLTTKKWFTDTLYLSWQDWIIKIYSTWDCIDPWTEIDFLTWSYQCNIEIIKNWETFTLNDPQKAYFSKIIFRIIPYDSSSNYLNWISPCTNYIVCIHKSWFFIITKAYSIAYNKRRYNRIQIPIQQFFNPINNNE